MRIKSYSEYEASHSRRSCEFVIYWYETLRPRAMVGRPVPLSSGQRFHHFAWPPRYFPKISVRTSIVSGLFFCEIFSRISTIWGKITAVSWNFGDLTWPFQKNSQICLLAVFIFFKKTVRICFRLKFRAPYHCPGSWNFKGSTWSQAAVPSPSCDSRGITGIR